MGIPAEEYTIAERFRDAGYATALLGKWHQGTRRRFHPNLHGFDEFYGLLGGYVGFHIAPFRAERAGVSRMDPSVAQIGRSEPDCARVR
jgi:arylsulfatase A-like enzyme